ncbi:hypothetical protein UFOVP1287_38 [uncultured Caudovirales phage]|uniref:Uncharacterized protein n=1 Tax=uncultured Caudovirales phage TaxID=2100421 RepID=A0A6J5RVA6_9CAUD|nr:hypothetical protein UFOVP1287_38 [uncultured Caudovirales phage]CAB4204966.1 hypothetical protein UFOVP1408_2 [uncultured Caudovirales phage]
MARGDRLPGHFALGGSGHRAPGVGGAQGRPEMGQGDTIGGRVVGS